MAGFATQGGKQADRRQPPHEQRGGQTIEARFGVAIILVTSQARACELGIKGTSTTRTRL